MKMTTIAAMVVLVIGAAPLVYAEYIIGERSTARSSAPGPFTAEEIKFSKAAIKVCSDKGGSWERDGNSITCYKEVN